MNQDFDKFMIRVLLSDMVVRNLFMSGLTFFRDEPCFGIVEVTLLVVPS